MSPQAPSLVFIGRIRTPFANRKACPRNIRVGDVEAVVEVDEAYREGLRGLAGISHVFLLYWLDGAERDILTVRPPGTDREAGVFATRAPVRPNPIGLAAVPVLSLAEDHLRVRGADCVDGTPLLDVKPYLPSVDAIPGAEAGWHARR